MSRTWSRQESHRQGIAWKVLFPTYAQFNRKILLRNSEYTEEEKEYIYKLLDLLLADKAFRFTSAHRCLFAISTKVETLLIMSHIFNNSDGTDYRVYKSESASATYVEAEPMELDMDDDGIAADDYSDIAESPAMRDSGMKSEDSSYNYSINEIINREKRIHDFIEKSIMPLFSSRTREFREENYDEDN